MIIVCISRRLVKVVTVCLLILAGGIAHAGFEFYSVDVDPVILTDDLGETFNYTFTATFDSYCTDGCTGHQDYGLGLSDTQDNLGEGDLGSFMGDRVYVAAPDSGGLTKKEFALGYYTGTWHPYSSQHPPPRMTATYQVTLKKSGLEKLYSQGANLDFYIRGVDMEVTSYYDQHYVEIPLSKPPIVKIVGLDDVIIDTSSTTNGSYQHKESFCVYVSESPHTYRISVKAENNQRDSFYLAQNEVTGADNAYLPYAVGFVSRSGTSSPWINTSGEYPATFTGGTDESCSSENMQVGIRVQTEDADQVPMGVYEDRMYITVKAQ